jgi:serine/threonine protein kinase
VGTRVHGLALTIHIYVNCSNRSIESIAQDPVGQLHLIFEAVLVQRVKTGHDRSFHYRFPLGLDLSMVWPLLVCLAVIFAIFHSTVPRYITLPNSDGHTSTVYLLPNQTNISTTVICKSIHAHFADVLLPIEKEAYQRFSSNNPPPSLLTYHGIHDEIPAGIILEFAESGNLQDWLLGGQRPSSEMLYKWTYQATEALEFAHGLGVLHADIHCLNFFITKALDLKVGDWGGASIDGEKSHCSYRYTHRLFGLDGTDVPGSGISRATEIFALGTAFYVMISGEEPWPELKEPKDREEIRRRIARRQFPATNGLRILSGVVAKCWNGEFGSMTEVRRAIESERDSNIEALEDETLHTQE